MIVKKMLRIRRRRGLCVDSSFVLDRKDPWTVLSEASDPEIIKMLLEYHASPNPRNCGTVLRVACQKLQVDSVKTLLKARASAAVPDSGASALFYAVYAVCPENRVDDKIALVNLLLDAGADACDINVGQSVLHWCLGYRSIDNAVLDVLLARCPALLHYRDDDDGTTVLMTMSMTRIIYPRLIRTLLDAGADAKATDDDNQTALFHLFSLEDDEVSVNVGGIREALLMLLSAGTDPTVCRDNGDTLLTQMLLLSMTRHHSDAAVSTWIGDILDSVLLRPREDVVADAVAYLPAAPVAPWQPSQLDEDVESSDDDLRYLRRERLDHVDGEVYSCDDDSRAYKKARR
jgi:ankyrin repeat protein